MKKFGVLILALVLSQVVFAQKFIPQIGIGTELNYKVEATAVGQIIPLNLKMVSMNDPMKFHWALPGLGGGNFLISFKALESGTKMRLEEPAPNEDTKYKDDETIMFISKASLAELTTTQSFTMNKIKFTSKPLDTPYQINGKDADVLHAVSSNGKIELWVLNNPNLPVICKMTGNPAGFDFNLTNVKE